MKRRTILALMSALAAPALLTAAAMAQPAPPPGAHGGHGGHGGHGAPGGDMKAHQEAMRKQHMEDMKIVLRLRPDQEPALAAFMAAHEPKRIERRLADPGKLTTPQRLEEMAKLDAEMDAHQKASRDALARFYAALSPDQQKVFDALHRLKGHGGPHVRRVKMGGPMGGHGPGAVMMMRRHGPGGGPHDD